MHETKPPSDSDPATPPPVQPDEGTDAGGTPDPADAAAPGPADAAPAADGAPTPPARPVKVKREESWWDTFRFLLYLFLGAVLLRTFLFAPFSIPSGSMLPNLLIGD